MKQLYRAIVLPAVLLTAFCNLALWGRSAPAATAPDAVATLMSCSGKVEFKRAGKPWSKLPQGARLNAEDLVRTGPKSKAQLAFYDGSIVRLNGGSTVRLAARIRSGKHRGSVLTVLRGQVWSKLRPGHVIQGGTAAISVRG